MGFNKRAVFLSRGQGIGFTDAPGASGVRRYMEALARPLIEKGAGMILVRGGRWRLLKFQ
jgi:hypothetical protein